MDVRITTLLGQNRGTVFRSLVFITPLTMA